MTDARTGDAAPSRSLQPAENAIINRFVIGTFIALCVSVTAAWWVLLARGTMWLVLD
jgi:hypothetical protein